MIIVLDGIDGSGKTTVASRLQTVLRECAGGRRVYLFRDPGGTPAGERLRAVVKDADIPLEPVAQMLVFSAARSQLAHEAVRPVYAEGHIAILDRWWFSTWAYQSAQGVDPDLIEHVAETTAKVRLRTDLCFWLDVSPEVAVARATAGRDEIPAGRDRFDQRDLAFRRQVRERYEALWKRGLLTRIDADGSPQDVWFDIWKRVQRALRIG